MYLPREISDKELIIGKGKSSGVAPGLKILVVDDEHQVLSIIMSLLDHQGCNVLTADKGMEALARMAIRSIRVTAITMIDDLCMSVSHIFPVLCNIKVNFTGPNDLHSKLKRDICFHDINKHRSSFS